jgi:hypothetical protein
LSTTIKKVKDLKTQLTTQKEEVTKVLATQTAARDSLQAKETEQARLLAQTQNDESKYQGMIKDSQAQIAEAKRIQAVLNARTNSTGGYTIVDSGSLGDYPWNNANCPMLGYLSTGGANGNGGDGRGYGCRQCASYVAWKIAKEVGIYYKWGNGGDFARNAINAGYQNLSLDAIAEKVRDIVGPPVEIVHTPTDDNRSYHISSEKILRELGFTPRFTIEDAIRELVEAFRAGKVHYPLTNPLYFNIKRMQEIHLQ